MDFLRPGLKTGVEMAFFGLKLGLELEIWAAHPHQKFQRVLPPTPGSDCAIFSKEILLKE